MISFFSSSKGTLFWLGIHKSFLDIFPSPGASGGSWARTLDLWMMR
jgi:hypothetical protein